MLTAIVRPPAASLTACELTYLKRVPISHLGARGEHATYTAVLRAAGLEVVVLPPLEAYPDSVFVEDAAVVLDELAVLTRPGAASRQAEPDFIAATLARYRPLAVITEPATLEGGDVLLMGRRLFVGVSTRTNSAGVAALRALAAPHGYRVTPVPVRGALHLKTAGTALDEDTLLANADWVDVEPFAGRRVLTVPPDEPWGANVLTVGEAVLVNAACTATADLLARAGYRVLPLPLDEFAKAEAGLTCLSLIFKTAAAPGSATPAGT